MKPALLMFFGLFFLVQTGVCQDTAVIDGSFTSGFFDAFNNAVLITNNEILKFDRNGKPLARYSNNILGKISSIDNSDPLKPMVFFGDAQMITYLNQQFSPVADPVSIAGDNQYLAVVACNQPSKGIWFFDSNSQSLYRMNPSNIIDIKSNELTYKLSGEEPTHLFFMNNKLYLVCKNGLILTFDAFGNLLQSCKIDEPESLISQNGSLFFTANQTFFQWNDGNLVELKIHCGTSEKPLIILQKDGSQMLIFKDKTVICTL